MSKQPVIRIFLALPLLCAPAAEVCAQQAQPQAQGRVEVKNDDYNTPEKRANIAARLDNPEREQNLKPEALIAAFGIKPGDRVADIGTGTGMLLPYLSRAVQRAGVVYAEDIFPDFLERARNRADQLQLDNVVFLLGGERNPRLPPATLDLAVMMDAYHHFEYPRAMLDSIRTALKPEGRIAIVDFYKRGSMESHVRLDRDAVAKEIEGFGWKLEASPDVVPSQFVLIFKRKPN